MASQLGPRGGSLGGYPYSTHKNTPYRLDKLCSALGATTKKPSFFFSILKQNIGS